MGVENNPNAQKTLKFEMEKPAFKCHGKMSWVDHGRMSKATHREDGSWQEAWHGNCET